MTKEQLQNYKSNQRVIERNRKKIEDEKLKDIPVINGKVTGSIKEFPYIPTTFSVQMDEPVEADLSRKRIERLQREIIKAQEENEQVERYIATIEDKVTKEIFTYRFIDGMRIVDIGKKLGYTHGRVSQIVKKFLKD